MNECILPQNNINQIQGINQNIDLNNQLLQIDDFNIKATNLRNKFIIPIIILPIIEFLIIIFTISVLNHSKEEAENLDISYIFLFPFSIIISIIIILTNSFCLNYPIIKILILAFLLLIKGFCVLSFVCMLYKHIICVILIIITFISLCACSIVFQIKLIKLLDNY